MQPKITICDEESENIMNIFRFFYDMSWDAEHAAYMANPKTKQSYYKKTMGNLVYKKGGDKRDSSNNNAK